MNKTAEIMEQIPRSLFLKELNKRREIEEQAVKIEKYKNEKEYNEKVSDTIFGTGQRPVVVGKMTDENPAMNYEFVDFKKIEKKNVLEYIDKNKLDYDISIKDRLIPVSFLDIKEGEIEKGKEWYLKYDPKLPTEIAEMMARYNWGDLKYMTKKNAKNSRKKLAKKGKDLGVEVGLTIRHCDKNNPIIVEFD